MNYPDKKQTVEVLAELARRVGHDAYNVRHPGDIAASMSFAIEYGGEMLALLHERGMLNDVPRTRA